MSAEQVAPAAVVAVKPAAKAAPVVTVKPTLTATTTPGVSTQTGTPAPAPADAEVAKAIEEKATAQRFAALVKKERHLQAERESMKTERASIAKLRSMNEATEAAMKLAKTNPLEAARALGLTYEDMTAAILNDGKATPDLHVKAVRDELEAFKKEQADAAKTAQDAAREAAVSKFRSSVGEFVKANAEEYQLVSIDDDGPDLVFATIEAQWGRDGTLLTNAQASAKVEKFLASRYEKYRTAKKYQAVQQSATPLPHGDGKQSQSAQPRTLSNDMTSSTQAIDSAVRSADERRKRALAVLSQLSADN